MYPIIEIQSYGIYRDIKYTKNLNNVLNQNVNETKRARFTTFALSIVDNLCHTALPQYRPRTQSKYECHD